MNISATAVQPITFTTDVPRPIVLRTRGKAHGPVTRLVSPSDIGELIKPFVFLDSFSMEPTHGSGSKSGFGWHPHSGIATVTVMLEGDAHYEESNGAKGILPEGGVEWMQAGNGVWHTGGPSSTRANIGFQLWVALPAEAENGPTLSQYLDPSEVMSDGPARVILGKYGQTTSKIKTASDMNYLDVSLQAGEVWTYTPPANHHVGWIAMQKGVVQTTESISAGELVVFEESEQAISFQAIEDTRFILGSAVKHDHDLVLGYYSVHTNATALNKGEANIQVLSQALQKAGVLR